MNILRLNHSKGRLGTLTTVFTFFVTVSTHATASPYYGNILSPTAPQFSLMWHRGQPFHSAMYKENLTLKKGVGLTSPRLSVSTTYLYTWESHRKELQLKSGICFKRHSFLLLFLQLSSLYDIQSHLTLVCIVLTTQCQTSICPLRNQHPLTHNSQHYKLHLFFSYKNH